MPSFSPSRRQPFTFVISRKAGVRANTRAHILIGGLYRPFLRARLRPWPWRTWLATAYDTWGEIHYMSTENYDELKSLNYADHWRPYGENWRRAVMERGSARLRHRHRVLGSNSLEVALVRPRCHPRRVERTRRGCTRRSGPERWGGHRAMNTSQAAGGERPRATTT